MFRRTIWQVTIFLITTLAAEKTRHQGKKLTKRPFYRPDYKIYHNWTSFDTYMTEMSKGPLAGSIITTFEHLSEQNRRIWRVNIRDPGQKPQNLKRIAVIAGIHAREFVVTESVIHLITNLSAGWAAPEGSIGNAWSRKVLSNFDIDLVPLLNPDGKVYLEKNKDFCWRWNADKVDLNRNFPVEFDGPGSSSVPGHEEYHGPKPFSTKEIQFLRDLVVERNYTAILDLHSGAQQIFIPFSGTKAKEKKLTRETTNTELAMVWSLKEKSKGYFWDCGINYVMNDYTADGTFMDWAAAEAKVPYFLTVEAWGDYTILPKNTDCFVQFNPPSNELAKALKDISILYTSTFEWFMDKSEHLVNSEIDLLDAETSMRFEKEDEIDISGFVVWSSILLVVLCASLYYLWNMYIRVDRQPRVILPSTSRGERKRLVLP